MYKTLLTLALCFSLSQNIYAKEEVYQTNSDSVQIQVGIPLPISNHFIASINLTNEDIEYRKVSFLEVSKGSTSYYYLYTSTALCGMSCLLATYKTENGKYCFIGFMNDNALKQDLSKKLCNPITS